MSAEKATAIVLRFVEWSESSGVVTLLTREFGKIGAVAKGARRPKSAFESALDLLASCRIVFLPKSSGALHVLTEARLLRRFRPSGKELSRLYAGYYVAELLLELTDEHDSQPELFDAADAVLASLGGEGAVTETVLWFELKSLVLLGHMPTLRECAECGRIIERTGRVSFAPLAGGVLCPRCRTGKRKVIAVSREVIDTLASATRDDWPRFRNTIDRKSWGELRAVMNQYLNHLVGKKLKMHDYLTR